MPKYAFTSGPRQRWVTSNGRTTVVASGVVRGPAGPPGVDGASATSTEIADQISTPGTPAHDALVAEVGAVSDPATASLITSASATQTAGDDRWLSGAASFQAVVRKLMTAQSASIGIASDSTADASNEWPALLGTLLGADFPTHTVRWYPAQTSPDGDGYGPPTTLQTGAGGSPPVLSIYNQAIAGHNALAWTGGTFAAQWLLTPALDLVIVSTGHNEGLITGDPSVLGFPRQQLSMRVQQFTESLRALSPSTGIVLLAQHEHQDGLGDMGIKRDEYRDLAARRGYGFLDVYQAWADLGAATSGWYADNIHLNLAGETFYADTVHAAFRHDPRIEPRPMPPSLLLDVRPSFCDELVLPLTATTPIGWTAANVTVTRDTTNFESARGYAVRTVLTTPGTTARIFRQVLNSTEILAFRGKWVTIAVRQRRVAAGGVLNRYTGQVAASDGVNNSKTFADDYSSGGFMWRFLPHFIDPTSTGLTVSLYADGTVNGSMTNPDVTWDRVLLIPGLTPAGWGATSGPRSIRNTAAFESVTVGDSVQPTTPVVNLNAATGIARAIQWLTAGALRWSVQVQTAESGSNNGSDMLFLARDDAAAFIGTALTLKRQTLAATFGSWVKTALYATGSRPNAVTAGDGAQAYDSTLHRPIWSEGSGTSAWNVGLVAADFGTGAGKVTEGNDARIGKINGTVAVSGTPTAGQTVVASSGTAAAWGPPASPDTYVIAGSDTANSTVTAADATGLAVPALADGTWEVEIVALCTSAATTTGAQVGLGAAPSGATVNIGGPAVGSNNATVIGFWPTSAQLPFSAASTGAPSAAGTYVGATFKGTIIAASMAGPLAVTIKSEVATSSVSIKAGSYIRYRKIA